MSSVRAFMSLLGVAVLAVALHTRARWLLCAGGSGAHDFCRLHTFLPEAPGGWSSVSLCIGGGRYVLVHRSSCVSLSCGGGQMEDEAAALGHECERVTTQHEVLHRLHGKLQQEALEARRKEEEERWVRRGAFALFVNRSYFSSCRSSWWNEEILSPLGTCKGRREKRRPLAEAWDCAEDLFSCHASQMLSLSCSFCSLGFLDWGVVCAGAN